MWVLLRLLVALVVGVWRFVRRPTLLGQPRDLDGTKWFLRQGKNKGRVVSNEMGALYQNSLYLRFSPESRTDRFFKATGFTHEMQSGDPAFDAKVYVSCDHPAIEPLLQESAELRRAILALFTTGFDQIRCDGEFLRAYRSFSPEPNDTDVRNLLTVRDALQAIPAAQMGLLRDRFFWRAALVGAVAWSLAWYAVPTLLELIGRSHPKYFPFTPVIKFGAIVGLGLFAGLFLLARMLLRGSSRAHRVLTESGLLLCFGLPLTAIQLVSDTNIAFDHSIATPIPQTVRDKYTTVSHGKGGSHTHYHLLLAPVRPEFPTFSGSIEVSRVLYDSVDRGRHIVTEMRRGTLGIPWVEAMHSPR